MDMLTVTPRHTDAEREDFFGRWVEDEWRDRAAVHGWPKPAGRRFRPGTGGVRRRVQWLTKG